LKIGFCTNVFSNEEFRPALKSLSEIGYDGVEIWDSYLQDTNLVELRACLDSLNLEVLQICPYFNVTGTRDELTETMKIAKNYIDIADKLNCKFIRVFTGAVSGRDATPQIYAQAVDALKEICALGSGSGLTYLVETHDGSLMDTGPAALKLIKDVDADNFKVNLQIPLDYGKEDVYESARLLGKHTIHIHAHNWIGGWPEFTLLGLGDYDFKKFLLLLIEQGFDGTISIEHAYHSNLPPLAIARKELAYLSQLRDELK